MRPGLEAGTPSNGPLPSGRGGVFNRLPEKVAQLFQANDAPAGRRADMEELASLVPTESKSRFVEEFQELISKDSVGTSMSAHHLLVSFAGTWNCWN